MPQRKHKSNQSAAQPQRDGGGKSRASSVALSVVGSMGRATSDADRLKLKAAFRRLAKRCGGLEAASMITRVHMARLGRYGTPHDPDFAGIDVALDLELDAGEPLVTAAMAALNGCILIPIPRATGDTRWLRRLSETARETGEAVAALGEALADGEITADEAPALRAEVADAIRALARVDAALKLVEEEGE